MSLLLSICIPTYNRVEKLIPHVNEILKCKSPLYEVVVIDNCSSDNTLKELIKIEDTHLRIVRHSVSVGGKASGIIALENSSSKYCLLLLDKDRLNGDYLYSFLEELNNSDYALGYCQLNATKKNDNIILEPDVESMINVGFTGMHPSGHFFNSSLYKNTDCVKDSLRYTFGFQIDIIQGYISQKGRALIYNCPLVFTETRDECSKIKSYSFINKKDCFFNYRGRAFQYMNYIKHCFMLILENEKKKHAFSILYEKGLREATFGYRSTMSDSVICNHYHIEPEHISKYKMIYASMYYFCFLALHLYRLYSLSLGYKALRANLHNVNSIIKNG